MTESKTRCEALEIEVVIARKELEKFQALYHQNISSIKASEELNNILNKQRSPLIKTGLGYEKGASSSQSENIEQTKMINFQSSKQSEFTKPAISIKAGANRNKSDDKLMTSKRNIATGTDDNTLHSRNHEEYLNIRIENSDQLYQSSSSNGQGHRKTSQSISRRQRMFRYHNFFHGYCLCCFNFGHKDAKCDFNFRSMR